MLPAGSDVTIQVAGQDFGTGDLPQRITDTLNLTVLNPSLVLLEPFNSGVTYASIVGTLVGASPGAPYLVSITVTTQDTFASSVDVLNMITAAMTSVAGTAPVSATITSAPDESNPAVAGAGTGTIPSVENWVSGFFANVGNTLNNTLGVANSTANAAKVLPWIILGGVALVIVVLASGRKSNLTSLIPPLIPRL